MLYYFKKATKKLENNIFCFDYSDNLFDNYYTLKPIARYSRFHGFDPKNAFWNRWRYNSNKIITKLGKINVSNSNSKEKGLTLIENFLKILIKATNIIKIKISSKKGHILISIIWLLRKIQIK